MTYNHPSAIIVPVDHSRFPLYVHYYLHNVPRGTLHVHPPRKLSSAAPAGAPAVHALVATAVADHDGAAERATGSVSHVDHAGKGIGRVDGTGRWSLVASH